MKCLRRKKRFLKQSLGQQLEANFQKVVRPFQYIQMDITGRHIASGGKEVYGLVRRHTIQESMESRTGGSILYR